MNHRLRVFWRDLDSGVLLRGRGATYQQRNSKLRRNELAK